MTERFVGVEQGERLSENRVFYLERDFYSNPQLLIIVARNIEEATEMLNQQLRGENYPAGRFGELKELDISSKGIQFFSPPGDRRLY